MALNESALNSTPLNAQGGVPTTPVSKQHAVNWQLRADAPTGAGPGGINTQPLNGGALNAAGAGGARVLVQHSGDYDLAGQSLQVAHEATWRITRQAVTQHDALWLMSHVLAQQHEAEYELSILSAQHSAPYQLGSVVAQHESEYDIRPRAVTQHEMQYHIRGPVTKQHESSHSLRVALQHSGVYKSRIAAQHIAPILYTLRGSHTATWSLNEPLAAQHEALHELLDKNPVQTQHEGIYGMRVSSSLEAPYSMFLDARAQHEAPYDSTQSVSAQHESEYELQIRNPVTRQHRAFWDMAFAGAVVITDIPYVELDGDRVEILSADINTDENGYAWLASVQIAKPEDYIRFAYDDAFVLNLLGDEYQLVVDAKNLRRGGPAQVDMEISGISPSARWGNPRASRLTKTWDTPVMARTAAEGVVGEAIDWQIMDWQIPAYRLGVSSSTPIEVVQLIARAAGGVVETKIDGTLLVRDRFPVSVLDYETATPDHVYTDANDNLSVSEGLEPTRLYNKFVVRDIQAGSVQRDSVEFSADENRKDRGTLRVYPQPLRPGLSISHTGDSSVVLSRRGDETREETETVELFDGSGNVKYPIESLVSLNWLGTSLGGVVFENYSTEIQSTSVSEKFGLCEVTYRTKSLNYHTENVDPEKVQFLVEDE